MLVSVVIVTFATPDEMLRDCVVAARASASSARCSVEVICVDNGQTASRYPTELALDVFIPMERNVGFARAANRGVAHAQGDVVLLLNPDVTLERAAIHHLRDALDACDGQALVGAWMLSDTSSLQVD